MLRRLRGWRCLIRTRRMAELTPFLRAPVVDDADLAINQKSSDNNEVRPRFSGATTERRVVLLCHKFHLWLRGRRRRQHGHRGRVFAIARASARRIVAIELGTCRCGRIGGASGSVITGKGIFFDWSGGTWS